MTYKENDTVGAKVGLDFYTLIKSFVQRLLIANVLEIENSLLYVDIDVQSMSMYLKLVVIERIGSEIEITSRVNGFDGR